MEKKYVTVTWPKSQELMDFKNLPVEIQERMLNEQVQQGNPRNAEVFENNIIANNRLGAFNWSESVEGYDFWEEIIQNGNFAIFYEKYPKS
jgi:hypothetical protein